MKFSAALLLLAAPALVAGLRAEDHPIGGVIKTLQKFAAEAEDEAKSEALTYEKFTYWCKNSQKSLGASIAEEKSDISSLSDTISSKQKEKEVLTEELKELAEELTQQAAAGKQAADSRADAKAIYDESSAALSSTISAIEDCIKILGDAKGSTDTGLLQQKVGKVLELASVWKGGDDMSSLYQMHVCAGGLATDVEALEESSSEVYDALDDDYEAALEVAEGMQASEIGRAHV